jgi:Flp pilus assembly protein TadG
MRAPGGDEGASSVEFALVLPIFVMLVGLGSYLSWIFFTQAQVDRAADKAARYVAVPTTAGDYAYCTDLVVARVNDDLISGSVDAADVTLSDSAGTVAEPDSTQADCPAPSGFVRVRVSRQFTNPFSYLIAPFTGSTSTFAVTGTGQVKVER